MQSHTTGLFPMKLFERQFVLNNPQTTGKLWVNNTQSIEEIEQNACRNVTKNFKKIMLACQRSKGGHLSQYYSFFTTISVLQNKILQHLQLFVLFFKLEGQIWICSKFIFIFYWTRILKKCHKKTVNFKKHLIKKRKEQTSKSMNLIKNLESSVNGCFFSELLPWLWAIKIISYSEYGIWQI